MIFTRLISTGLFIALGTVAAAQEVESSLGLSTLGLTGSASYEVAQGFSVRGIAGTFGSASTDIDDFNFGFASNATGTAEGSLNSLGVLVDYDIGDTGMFVSGGLMMMDLDLTATATGLISLASGASANTTVESAIKFENQVAPMVSVGYSRALGDQWKLYGEVGAIITGGVDISLEETGGNNFSQADLDAEVDTIQDDVDFGAYPFVSLGASFSF